MGRNFGYCWNANFTNFGQARVHWMKLEKAMSVKSKLLKRIIAQFPWVREDAKIVRCYPSSVEREAGAFLWQVVGYDIGSCFTMTQCVAANEWKVCERTHDFEVLAIN